MTTPFYRHLGASIRAAKGDRTVRELAAAIGVSPSALSSWMSAERRIPVEQLRDLARVLGTDAAALIADAEARMGAT